MSVFGLLHKMIKKSLPQLHSKRINALMTAAQALILGKKLTLTGIARSMCGACSPKSAIRKVDRLLGNQVIHSERQAYYQYFANLILSGIANPLISVDWTGTPRHNYYCLRASVNLKGRSFVLYEEVHPRKLEKNTRVQSKFLQTLKSLLPKECIPIIITDAGFRVPWFKKVESLGWHFLGRVRNCNNYYCFKTKIWSTTYELYTKVTSKARLIGNILLTKSSKLDCYLYCYKGKIKGRKHYNRSGKISQRGESKVHSKSHRDPLVIATSLIPERYFPKQIIKIYEKRMEIEEEFRDLKSQRYGFGMRESGTKSSARLEILLLVSAIANFICWLTALKIKRDRIHHNIQANTVKDYNVLSIQYLACEAFRWLGAKLKLKKTDILYSLSQMRLLCTGGANG